MSLPAFLTFLKASQLSPKTIRNYSSDVSQFLTWVGDKTVDATSFVTYKAHLESRRTPLATLTRHLSALRKFAQFLNLPVNLNNPPLPLIPTILKNFRFHLTKNRS